MRNFFRRVTPGRDTVNGMLGEGRWQRRFGQTLLAPDLWRLSCRSVAGGVAVGLFCGLVPGPFQMLVAALAALVLRVNLPLALFTTLYTNPLTIIPLYLVAFKLGQWVVGDGKSVFVAPPDFVFSDVLGSLRHLYDWLYGLGQPLGIGLILLASLLAAAGYLLVWSLWRLHVLRYQFRRRRRTK